MSPSSAEPNNHAAAGSGTTVALANTVGAVADGLKPPTQFGKSC